MKDSPKDFALQLGALGSLYISITSIITLLFGVITIMLPDAADSYYQVESASNTIKFSTAILVVFFPVFLWLTRTMQQQRRQESHEYLSITRWLIYLSLVVVGGVLLGDIVAVLYSYLNGELTSRFLLKAIVLAAVLGTAFYYYRKDAQAYWKKHEAQSKLFGLGAIILVVGSLVLGFMYSQTPSEVREARIDEKQVQDLQTIQWRVEEQYHLEEELPSDLNAAFSDLSIPTAPAGREPYSYSVTGEDTYELCATFVEPTVRSDYEVARPVIMERNYNWEHGTGEWCFERAIVKPLR
ncbi:DUF5671 domain-containing protein [Candidatus Pacebacteria bacterium]|nr:DUF5671 domain-containing protein [Candidatus Paceibacterota bacterium]